MMIIYAFIPARKISERLPGKNWLPFHNDMSLVEIALKTALKVKEFKKIVLSVGDMNAMAKIFEKITEKKDIEKIICIEQPADCKYDIDWIYDIFQKLSTENPIEMSAFAILRPTSPFRTEKTIKRALKQYNAEKDKILYSLKSVHRTKPSGKHWNQAYHDKSLIFSSAYGNGLFFDFEMPDQSCSVTYVQDGCIDICSTGFLFKHDFKHYISSVSFKFETIFPEGIQIDTKENWDYAQFLAPKYLK